MNRWFAGLILVAAIVAGAGALNANAQPMPSASPSMAPSMSPSPMSSMVP